MAIKVNFGGLAIRKPGYYGWPWWDQLQKKLKELNYNKDQIVAFIQLQDTLIRLDMHKEGFWKGQNA